eukprot:ctg_177.g76
MGKRRPGQEHPVRNIGGRWVPRIGRQSVGRLTHGSGALHVDAHRLHHHRFEQQGDAGARLQGYFWRQSRIPRHGAGGHRGERARARDRTGGVRCRCRTCRTTPILRRPRLLAVTDGNVGAGSVGGAAAGECGRPADSTGGGCRSRRPPVSRQRQRIVGRSTHHLPGTPSVLGNGRPGGHRAMRRGHRAGAPGHRDAVQEPGAGSVRCPDAVRGASAEHGVLPTHHPVCLHALRGCAVYGRQHRPESGAAAKRGGPYCPGGLPLGVPGAEPYTHARRQSAVAAAHPGAAGRCRLHRAVAGCAGGTARRRPSALVTGADLAPAAGCGERVGAAAAVRGGARLERLDRGGQPLRRPVGNGGGRPRAGAGAAGCTHRVQRAAAQEGAGTHPATIGCARARRPRGNRRCLVARITAHRIPAVVRAFAGCRVARTPRGYPTGAFRRGGHRGAWRRTAANADGICGAQWRQRSAGCGPRHPLLHHRANLPDVRGAEKAMAAAAAARLLQRAPRLPPVAAVVGRTEPPAVVGTRRGRVAAQPGARQQIAAVHHRRLGAPEHDVPRNLVPSVAVERERAEKAAQCGSGRGNAGARHLDATANHHARRTAGHPKRSASAAGACRRARWPRSLRAQRRLPRRGHQCGTGVRRQRLRQIGVGQTGRPHNAVGARGLLRAGRLRLHPDAVGAVGAQSHRRLTGTQPVVVRAGDARGGHRAAVCGGRGGLDGIAQPRAA